MTIGLHSGTVLTRLETALLANLDTHLASLESADSADLPHTPKVLIVPDDYERQRQERVVILISKETGETRDFLSNHRDEIVDVRVRCVVRDDDEKQMVLTALRYARAASWTIQAATDSDLWLVDVPDEAETEPYGEERKRIAGVVRARCYLRTTRQVA